MSMMDNESVPALIGLSEGFGSHSRCATLPTDYRLLTQPDRRAVREEYARRQGGNCAHCARPLLGPAHESALAMRVNARLFPPNFFKWPVHLHHCHKTGMTIGAVHNHCNAVLWQHHGE